MGAQLALASMSKVGRVTVVVRRGKDWEQIQKRLLTLAEEPFWKRWLGRSISATEAVMRINFTDSTSDIQDCDLVIEAVGEDIKSKSSVIAEVNAVTNMDQLFATSTSGLSVEMLAQYCNVPQNFFGLHFFNPMSTTRLVELIVHRKFDRDTICIIAGFLKEIGKKELIVEDKPGFLVNRLMVPFYLDAIRELEENSLMTPGDIDTALKLACGHPAGPLEISDMVGLDILLECSRNIFELTCNSRFKPPELLVKMVSESTLGAKTGKGFYSY